MGNENSHLITPNVVSNVIALVELLSEANPSRTRTGPLKVSQLLLLRGQPRPEITGLNNHQVITGRTPRQGRDLTICLFFRPFKITELSLSPLLVNKLQA